MLLLPAARGRPPGSRSGSVGPAVLDRCQPLEFGGLIVQIIDGRVHVALQLTKRPLNDLVHLADGTSLRNQRLPGLDQRRDLRQPACSEPCSHLWIGRLLHPSTIMGTLAHRIPNDASCIGAIGSPRRRIDGHLAGRTMGVSLRGPAPQATERVTFR